MIKEVFLSMRAYLVGPIQSIYISVIEVTAPAIVLLRCDSPHLLCLLYSPTTGPDRLTEQAGEVG